VTIIGAGRTALYCRFFPSSLFFPTLVGGWCLSAKDFFFFFPIPFYSGIDPSLPRCFLFPICARTSGPRYLPVALRSYLPSPVPTGRFRSMTRTFHGCGLQGLPVPLLRWSLYWYSISLPPTSSSAVKWERLKSPRIFPSSSLEALVQLTTPAPSWPLLSLSLHKPLSCQ